MVDTRALRNRCSELRMSVHRKSGHRKRPMYALDVVPAILHTIGVPLLKNKIKNKS